MTRVKAGVATRKRHNKMLKAVKGYVGTLSSHFKKAKQAWIKAGQHAYRHRRQKKRTLRGLFIVRINAILRSSGLKYSTFINKLKQTNIILDRKVLSLLAQNHPKVFTDLINKVK